VVDVGGDSVTQIVIDLITGGTDRSLARPGRKQATATEDFEFPISYRAQQKRVHVIVAETERH